ncbi:MAG: hypothetical protein ACYSUI_18870 [Planctomycetota bacterium]|jgi:hypothetical protein
MAWAGRRVDEHPRLEKGAKVVASLASQATAERQRKPCLPRLRKKRSRRLRAVETDAIIPVVRSVEEARSAESIILSSLGGLVTQNLGAETESQKNE